MFEPPRHEPEQDVLQVDLHSPVQSDPLHVPGFVDAKFRQLLLQFAVQLPLHPDELPPFSISSST